VVVLLVEVLIVEEVLEEVVVELVLDEVVVELVEVELEEDVDSVVELEVVVLDVDVVID
jgi:hypothetical protein